MKGKLFAVGIGTGEPELITLKALEVLKNADIIAAIRIHQVEDESKALSIINSILEIPEEKLFRIVFPSKGRYYTFIDLWLLAAEKIWKLINKGKKVAFVVTEDPVTHSVFSYLADIMESEYGDFPLEIIPGITSFSFGAAFLKIPLVLQDEKLAVLPAPVTRDDLVDFSKKFDTIAIVRPQLMGKEIISMLRELELIDNAYFLGLNEETKEYFNIDISVEEEIGHLVLIIIKNIV